MSVSGLFLVLFLLFHMSMNLAAVFSTEAYNAICEFLGANWYALRRHADPGRRRGRCIWSMRRC